MSVSVEPEYTIPEGAIDGTPTVPSPEAPVTPPPTPAGTPPGGVQTPEDRVPYTRFQEVVSARRQAEQTAAEARAEATILRRQIEALTGIKAPEQVDPQEQAIREQLERMYPFLRKMQNIPLEKIEAMLETVPQLQAQAQSQYDSQADQTVSSLYAGAKATIYGGRDLTPFQQQNLHRAFVFFVENDPQNTTRYVSRDPSLVTEFLKRYAAEMIEPVSRQAAVQVGTRIARTATVPTGGGAGGPVGTAPPVIPQDEDARHEAAWQAVRLKLGG